MVTGSRTRRPAPNGEAASAPGLRECGMPPAPSPLLRHLCTCLLRVVLLWVAVPMAARAAPPVPPQAQAGLPGFQHSAWRVGQGAPGDVWDIAQDRQGTLLLATGSGLYRFDGHRFERDVAPRGSSFPSTNMVSLLLDPDDSLWIGYFQAGISHLQRGGLHSFLSGRDVPSGPVPRMARDGNGRLWAALSGGLRWHDGQRWQPPTPAMQVPDLPAHWLQRDQQGTLWLLAGSGLWRLPRGASRFETTDVEVSPRSVLAERADGSLWLADRRRGILPLARHGMLLSPAQRESQRLPDLRADRMLFARDGSLWASRIGSGGVVRLSFDGAQPGQLESFDVAQGLTSTSASPLLEDREGNIWIGTNLGLNRFRARSVHALQDVGPSGPYRTLYRTAGGQVQGYDDDLRTFDLQRALVHAGPAAMQRASLQSTVPLWLFHDDVLYRRTAGRTVAFAAPSWTAGQSFNSVFFAAQGEAWACAGPYTLHFKDGRWRNDPRLPARSCSLVSVDERGRVLVGHDDGTLHVVDGHSVRAYGPAQGLDVGPVTAVYARGDELLVAGESGLAALEGARFHVLQADIPGVLEGITGIAGEATGTRWLNGSRGLLRTDAEALRMAAASARPLSPRLFDDADGMPGIALQSSPAATAMLADDGLLWLATNQGLAWLDTALPHRNERAPDVRIGEVSFDGQHAPLHDGLRLPAGTDQLQIDYVALSLARPERTRYRYQLSGVDSSWQEAGGQTRAHYTNLVPGNYRFAVMAANEDGVWSSTPAVRSFQIAPTFVQTLWFKLLCVLAVLGLLVMAVRIRSGQLAALVRARLQERHGERERIARDLHDTLLQGSQGLILRLHAISQSAQASPAVRSSLEAAMQLAEQNLAEGRERVAALRDGPAAGQDLVTALAHVHEEFAGEGVNPLRLTIEGAAPPLQAHAAEEVFLIGREAIRNALHHAQAGAIEVELAYGRSCLLLHVRDDGRGMVDTHGAADGHWGMQGMRERARRLGGELRVWSRPGLGTEIALSVPAHRIYRQRPSPWRRWWPNRKTPA